MVNAIRRGRLGVHCDARTAARSAREMLQVDMLGQWRGSAPASAFPLQLGVRIGRGYIGLEDEVLVTEDSDDYLSSVQRELIFVE